MKKLSFILGAALLLASCSNDDLVKDNKVGKQGEPAPIGFNIRKANMNRGTTQMEDVGYEFGVYAYKAADFASIDLSAANTVMPNYLVGYWNGTDKGYKPAGTLVCDEWNAQNDWYYEGLGNGDGATFMGVDGYTAAVAQRTNQFLKYWDREIAYTYFFAYYPYQSAGLNVVKDGNNIVLKYPAITSADNAKDYMWAYTPIKNTDMIVAGATTATYNQTVPLTFNHMLSRIRVAFWGEIKGYSIEVVSVKAVPQGEGLTQSGELWATFTGTATNVVYNAATRTTADINFVSPMGYDCQMKATTLTTIQNSRDQRLGSKWVNVMPNNTGASNGAMNFQIRLKLTSDSGEVSHYDAVVPVAASYQAWLPNHQYIYIFHITKDMPGNDGNPLLLPIIFDDVLVSDYENGADHYDWNLDNPNDWQDDQDHGHTHP